MNKSRKEREAEAYADEIIRNGENQTAAEVYLERSLNELGYTPRQAEALVSAFVAVPHEEFKNQILNLELSESQLDDFELQHFGPTRKSKSSQL